MVDKIHGNNSFGQVGQLNRPDKTTANKKADQPKASDRVDFSSALKSAEQTKATTSTQETARMDKIAALKSQIQNGEYHPDLNKVAASMLPFLTKES